MYLGIKILWKMHTLKIHKKMPVSVQEQISCYNEGAQITIYVFPNFRDG